MVAEAPVYKPGPINLVMPSAATKGKVTTAIEDDINAVAFNDTVRQGSSTKVCLISLEKMREGRARYKQREWGLSTQRGDADSRTGERVRS